MIQNLPIALSGGRSAVVVRFLRGRAARADPAGASRIRRADENPDDQPDLKRDDREARMTQSTSTLSAGAIELTARAALRQREDRMVLATAKVADFDQFWNVFSTQGAEKRGQHGSKGANVFRDPNDADRVWVVFDWDDAGWKSFTSDPDVPAIFQQAGFTEGPPKAAEFVREHHA
jgi:hypothetical protein